MAKGLRAGRFHEVIVLSNKECEVRTWELQSGLLVYIVKALYQKTLVRIHGEETSIVRDAANCFAFLCVGGEVPDVVR